MLLRCSSSLARRLATGAAGLALALLGGCVVAPVGPYEVGAPVVYSDGAYAPYYGNAYYGAPTYYGAPYYRPYWGPAVSLGIWGGWGGGGRSYSGPRHYHGRGMPGRGGPGGHGGFGRR